MHCTCCGTLLPEGANFCTNCGAPAAPAQEPDVNTQEKTTFEPSEGYKAAAAQLPPSYSNPNYGSTVSASLGKTNGFAIAGFICSLVFWPMLLSPFTAIAGLILSIIGLNKAKKTPEKNGRGLSIAGIIISALRLVLLVIVVLVFIGLFLLGVGRYGQDLFSNWAQNMPYMF